MYSTRSLLRNIPQIRTIITSNLDTLFEKTFSDELEVIIDEESIATADSLKNRDKVKLFKVPSDFANTDSMIIAKSDYINFFFNEQDSLIWTEIRAIVAKKSILFIGYSLKDPNFQYIFDRVLARLQSSSKECF